MAQIALCCKYERRWRLSIRLNKGKLDALLEKRGYSSYQEAGDAAKQKGLPLAWRTIYAMVDGGNWRKESLEALCALLGCTPADIIDGWENGGQTDTHASPRPEEELQGQPA